MTKHIILLIIYSFISTLLPLPISPIVIYFYANLTKYNIIITILAASIADTLTAILVYYIFLRFNYERFEYYTKPLKRAGMRGKYAYAYINTKLYDILSDERTQTIVNKYGIIAVAFAAGTPLPFSATLYAAGIVGYGKPLTLGITTFIGRVINYSLMWLLGMGVISI